MLQLASVVCVCEYTHAEWRVMKKTDAKRGWGGSGSRWKSIQNVAKGLEKRGHRRKWGKREKALQQNVKSKKEEGVCKIDVDIFFFLSREMQA